MVICVFVLVCPYVHFLRCKSRISKMLKKTESLGKSSGKNWFHIKTFLVKNGLKSTRWKKFFTDFFFICLLLRYSLNIFLPHIPKFQCTKKFKDSESLGKSNGKNGSQMWTFLLQKCLTLLRQKKKITNFFLPLFTPFKRLFFPTSQSPMSKIFRFSKSLG